MVNMAIVHAHLPDKLVHLTQLQDTIAFECDDAIRRAQVSRKSESSRLLHREDADGVLRVSETGQANSDPEQILAEELLRPPIYPFLQGTKQLISVLEHRYSEGRKEGFSENPTHRLDRRS